MKSFKNFLIKIGAATLAIFIIFRLISSFAKLSEIAQLNLDVFGIIVSLCGGLALTVLMAEFDEKKIILKKSLFRKIVAILVMLILPYFTIRKDVYDYSLFKEWPSLSWYDLLLVTLFILLIHYGIAEMFVKSLLGGGRFSLVEKLVFYPLISAFILAIIGVALSSFKLRDFYHDALLVILALLLISIILYFFNYCLPDSIVVSVSSILQASCLVLIIAFRFYVLWYVLGAENTFLKWDSFYVVWYIAKINRFGLLGYLSAPYTERYPIFYFLVWSSLSKIMPFPLINLLVIVAFFIQAFSVLSYYLLLFSLTKDRRKSLLSVIIYNLLSGFSWLYLFSNPPAITAKKDIISYVRQIHDKFGMYSGSTVSLQYIDIHTLTRLFSLSIFFSVVSALIILIEKIGKSEERCIKDYLIIFCIGFLMIALGHPTELILLSITIFALFLLTKKEVGVERVLLRCLTVLAISSSVIGVVLGYSLEIMASYFVPLFAGILGVAAKRLSIKLLSKVIFRKINEILIKAGIIFFIAYYFVSIFTFFSNYDKINVGYPIYTHWFIPPIEWGFLGLIFVIYLVKILNDRIRLDFHEKFALLNVLLLFMFTKILDFVNLNYIFLGLPYPTMPIYFFPFFGIVTSELVPHRKGLGMKVFAALFCVILAFGAFDHAISSSYWNLVSYYGEIFGSPAPSRELISIADSIYQDHPKNSFEIAAIVTEYDPFPLNLSDYQFQVIVRYDKRGSELKSILRAAGVNPPEKCLEWAFYSLSEREELLLLRSLLPIRYVVVDKGTPSLARNVISNFSIVIETQKYIVYDLGEQITSRYMDFLITSHIRFNGDIRISSAADGRTLLNVSNVDGTIIGYFSNRSTLVLSLKGLEVTMVLPVKVYINGKIEFDNVASTWRYFPEALCVARKVIVDGYIAFDAISAFQNKIYLTNLNLQGQVNIRPPPWHVSGGEATRTLIKEYYYRFNIPITIISENRIVLSIMVIIIFLLLLKSKLLRISILLNRDSCDKTSRFKYLRGARKVEESELRHSDDG